MLEDRRDVLLSRLSPAELEKAEALAQERIRVPCSAGIGAFQVMGVGKSNERARGGRWAGGDHYITLDAPSYPRLALTRTGAH